MKKCLMLAAAVFCVAASTDAAQRPRRPQNVPRAEDEADREQARFRALDVNADGVVTREEWRGSGRAFARFDTNRDGRLSGSEIWIGGRRQPARPDEDRLYTAEDRRRDELLEVFYRSDRNDDDRLSPNEWRSDRAAFERADRNRDGWITRQEYLLAEDAIAAPTGTAGDPRRDTPGYKSGYERGLIEGRQAGKEDKERNMWDLEGQRELEQADSGYTPQLGLREDYQAGYRAGFRLGYRQGFGPR
jgi:hypothetical protein